MRSESRELCTFCWAIESEDPGMTAEYQRLYPDRAAPTRVVSRGDPAVAFVALGPIAAGNILVVPADHYVSLAECPASVLAAVRNEARRLTAQLRGWDDDVIWFEHGGDIWSETRGGCVEHVHLQVTPAKAGTMQELREQLGNGVEISKLQDLEAFREHGPYLYVESDASRLAVVYPRVDIESQFMRKILFSRNGEPERWNWRVYPGLERIENTMLRIRPRAWEGRTP